MPALIICHKKIVCIPLLSPALKWSAIFIFFLIVAFLLVFLVILGFFAYTHAPYIYNSSSSRGDFGPVIFTSSTFMVHAALGYNFCLLNE